MVITWRGAVSRRGPPTTNASTARAMWPAIDHTIIVLSPSGSRDRATMMSVTFSIIDLPLGQLCHDADVLDTGGFQLVQYVDKVLHLEFRVPAQEYLFVCAIDHLLPKPFCEDPDGDWLLTQDHAAVFSEAFRHVHEDSFARDLVRLSRLRQFHFHAALQHRRGDHEDDQQHEHHVDERDDVDLGKGRPQAPAALVPAAGVRRGSNNFRHYVKFRSAIFRNSSAKSSISAEKSFTRCTK